MPLRAEILVPVCTAVLIVCYPLGLGFEALKKLHSHGGRTTFSELRTGTIIRLLEYLSRLALSGGGCSGRCLFCCHASCLMCCFREQARRRRIINERTKKAKKSKAPDVQSEDRYMYVHIFFQREMCMRA